MNFLSTKSRMALGQVSLVVSVLMTASLLGLMPDRIAAVREGRAALAEAIAGYCQFNWRLADWGA